MAPPRGSRRDSAKQKTRQALLEAGLAEVVERGMDRPSLDSICARAGFTRGAFYVHFKDRRDFLEQLMEWSFQSFLDAALADTRERGVAETVSRFTAAVRDGRTPLQRQGMRITQLLDAAARTAPATRTQRAFFVHVAEQLAAQARRGQAAGEVRSDIDADAIGRILLLLAVGALSFEEFDMVSDLDRLRDAVLRLLAP